MGLLTDILKEIPQAAVLKEKIATIEAKYAASDTENAILKDDLREANAEIAKLKKQIEEPTHTDDLNELELQILVNVATHEDANVSSLARKLGIHSQRVQFHVAKLQDLQYLKFIGFSGEGVYLLEQKGREALMKHGLI